MRPPCKNLTVFQWKFPCQKDSIFYVDLKNRIYKENLYKTLVTVRSLGPMVVIVKVSVTGISRTELNLVPRSYSSTALSLHPCSPYSYQRVPSTFCFKGASPHNLDESSKLLYSKELGWFSQPQKSWKGISSVRLYTVLFSDFQRI